MVIFALFSLPSLHLLENSQAADCSSKACIKVFTENGQIVIEGKRGGGARKIAAPAKPAARPTKIQAVKPNPVSTKPVAIKPVAIKPAPAQPRTLLPVLKKSQNETRKKLKPPVKRKAATGISLNDRLVKLLPTAKIAKAPKVRGIINVPMIFWCDLPTHFVAQIPIVGEVVDIAMRPAFFWSFGDGAVLLTTLPGADYPRADISHTYRRPGRYLVTLVATWGGSWSVDGASRAITGKVRQITVGFVDVLAAPTIITRLQISTV